MLILKLFIDIWHYFIFLCVAVDKFAGSVRGADLGVVRLTPSRESTHGATVSPRGKIFKIVDNSGQLVPIFLSKC